MKEYKFRFCYEIVELLDIDKAYIRGGALNNRNILFK